MNKYRVLLVCLAVVSITVMSIAAEQGKDGATQGQQTQQNGAVDQQRQQDGAQMDSQKKQDQSQQNGQDGAGQMQQGQGHAGVIQNDVQLAKKVQQELSRQADIQGAQDLFVSARNGRIVLLGWTNSDEAKDRLEEAAKNIQGVREVDNELEVHEGGWEQKSDQQLRDDVQGKLYWSWFVDSDQVDVSVQNGTATLSGTVENWGEMNDVIRNAYEGGARSVKSNLRIQERSGRRNGTTNGETDRRDAPHLRDNMGSSDY